MQKEIYEQPLAIKNTMEGRLRNETVEFSELGEKARDVLSGIEHIQIVACGTSFNLPGWSPATGLKLWQVFRVMWKSPEFRYRKPACRKNSLLITISQSG